MSRYDGLIIPRSYSEYINKTDAATLQQALQLSGVLSGAVAAGDNKAVKSSAVNNALTELIEVNDITSQIIPGENVTIREKNLCKTGNTVSCYVRFTTTGLARDAMIINNLPRLSTLYFDTPILEHDPDILVGFVRLNRRETMSDIVVEKEDLPAGTYRFSIIYICD